MLASREVFDAAFVEFGLPTTLRTDNGTPFSGAYGVSALSVWWVKLVSVAAPKRRNLTGSRFPDDVRESA